MRWQTRNHQKINNNEGRTVKQNAWAKKRLAEIKLEGEIEGEAITLQCPNCRKFEWNPADLDISGWTAIVCLECRQPIRRGDWIISANKKVR